MRFKPTKSGGRVFECDLPHGQARVEWDCNGKLVSESIEIREPSPPLITSEQEAIVAARKPICEPCPENKGLTLYTVKCRECGCSGVSLIHGSCKLGKWT